MCEQYVACAEKPFEIDSLWPFTERLERFGIAGFGWGATWLDPRGELRSYRDVGSFADDSPGQAGVARAPAPSVQVRDHRARGYATVRRPGRAVRVQSQRRPRAPRGVPGRVPEGRSAPRQGGHRGRRP